MYSHKILKVLHLTTHLNIGGVTSYVRLTGSAQVRAGFTVGVLSGGGELADEFVRAGMSLYTYPLHVKNELHPGNLLCVLRAARLVRKEKFDVLHAHTRVTQLLATLVSRATGVPLVTTAHGFFKPHIGRQIVKGWGSRVIAISPLVAESLTEAHHVDPERVRVIPNAIDIDESGRRLAAQDAAGIRFEYGIPKDALVLSSISRLVADKGHGYLIQALKLLADKGRNAHLVILGDGRERGNLQHLINSLGLSDRARILPFERDISKVLAVTDIFVHPATYREGFGLVIAEAMAAGIPVLATNIPAINTLVEDGRTGRMVAAKDAAALAMAVMDMADHPERTRALAEAGRKKALELCSLERMIDRLTDVYREVVR